MSWLRIDDGFTKHPKIIALSTRQRWLWLDLLCWCARYKTKGVIPEGAVTELRIRSSDLDAWRKAGLIEAVEGVCVVHDWAVYNPADPTAADRMKRNRERQPRPATNRWEKTRADVLARDAGICADCGEYDEGWNADHVPDRAELEQRGLSIHDIDYIVTRCHSCHAKKTRREAVARRGRETEPRTEPSRNGSVASRVGTRARPVPSSSDEPRAVTVGGAEAPSENSTGFKIPENVLQAMP